MILQITRKELRPIKPVDENSTDDNTETIIINETIDGIERTYFEQYGDRHQDTEHLYNYFVLANRQHPEYVLDILDTNLIRAFLLNDNGKTIQVLKK